MFVITLTLLKPRPEKSSCKGPLTLTPLSQQGLEHNIHKTLKTLSSRAGLMAPSITLTRWNSEQGIPSHWSWRCSSCKSAQKQHMHGSMLPVRRFNDHAAGKQRKARLSLSGDKGHRHVQLLNQGCRDSSRKTDFPSWNPNFGGLPDDVASQDLSFSRKPGEQIS